MVWFWGAPTKKLDAKKELFLIFIRVWNCGAGPTRQLQKWSKESQGQWLQQSRPFWNTVVIVKSLQYLQSFEPLKIKSWKTCFGDCFKRKMVVDSAAPKKRRHVITKKRKKFWYLIQLFNENIKMLTKVKSKKFTHARLFPPMAPGHLLALICGLLLIKTKMVKKLQEVLRCNLVKCALWTPVYECLSKIPIM